MDSPKRRQIITIELELTDKQPVYSQQCEDTWRGKEDEPNSPFFDLKSFFTDVQYNVVNITSVVK